MGAGRISSGYIIFESLKNTNTFSAFLAVAVIEDIGRGDEYDGDDAGCVDGGAGWDDNVGGAGVDQGRAEVEGKE